MSLYRQADRIGWRRVAGAAALTLIVGLAIGFGLGRATAPEPTLAEQLTELRDSVQPVLSGLELVPDHYSQAVRDGEVVGDVQYSGTQQQAATAQSSLSAVAGELRLVDPEGVQRAEDSIDALIEAIDARRAAAQVDALAARAAAAVSEAVGADSG